MADTNETIEDFAEAFDDAREELLPDNVQCFLLSLDGDEAAYKVELELVSGWFIDYSKYRGLFELWYATTDTDFPSILELSSSALFRNEVYEIDKSESVPPTPSSPYFTIACRRTGEKFTPPES